MIAGQAAQARTNYRRRGIGHNGGVYSQ